MRGIICKIVLSLAFISISFASKAQGCSDAGFCTISSFKPNGNDSIKQAKNQFKVGMNYGSADNSILVVGNYLEYNRKINEKLGFDVKLTSLLQSGNAISAFGFSDIYINANYKVKPNTGLILGFKIPLTDGNTMQDDLPFPMDYQASLGTFDLLIGIAQEIGKFQIILALQQPLTQNSNAFLASQYPTDSPLRTFQSTNNYKRNSDVLLRFSYPFELNSKLKLTPSVLSIYHLADDEFTNSNDVEETITGSEGLTLNVNIYLDYVLNEKSALQLNLAGPLLIRDARPDGLTRSFVINLEYKFNF